MPDMPEPTHPRVKTHLTRDELREYWLADLARVDEELAQRYRNNLVLFPMSRQDLIAKYTQVDLMEFKLKEPE